MLSAFLMNLWWINAFFMTFFFHSFVISYVPGWMAYPLPRPSMMLEKYYDSRSEFERDLDRFAAFSRVFTRNHLYRIELLMSEIQVTTPPPPPSTLFNKISLLFDMLHMALAYYIRSVKTFPKHIAFEKTMRLVYFVGDTVRLCVERNFFDGDDFVIQVIYKNGFVWYSIFVCCLLFVVSNGRFIIITVIVVVVVVISYQDADAKNWRHLYTNGGSKKMPCIIKAFDSIEIE